MKACEREKRSRLLYAVAALAIPTLLAACAGFTARQPDPDVHEILVLRNGGPNAATTFSKYLIEPQPQPLPLVSGTEFDTLLKKAQPPAVRPSSDVPPINVGPNEVTATPLGQAVTQQANYLLDPMRTSGRFNFTKANGSPRYCTAQFVGDTGVVLTAAHCVFDGRFGGGSGTGWIADAEFAHAYGSANPGASYYDWECIAIYKGWALDDPAFDYAFVKLAGAGARALGLRPSTFGSQRATSQGYPSNISSFVVSYVNGVPSLASPSLLQHAPNPFGGGSSGGAWIDSDRAESLNSFGRSDRPNTMFGPIFGGRTVELFDYVRGGCVQAKPLASASTGTKASIAPKAEASPVNDATLFPRKDFADVATLPRQADTALAQRSPCSCSGAKPLYAVNNTDAPRRLTLTVRRSQPSGKSVQAPDAVLDLGPREQRQIGCTRVENACDVSQDIRVKATTRLRVTTIAGAASPPSSADTPVSIDACVARCNAGDDAWCQRLGGRPSDALMPLAELLRAASNPPDSNSIVLRREQVITALGGDPAKDTDPCARSDLVGVGHRVVNSGGQCVVQSRSISSDPSKELALVLHLNSHLSWLKNSREDATFDKAQEEPYVAFLGQDSDVLTDAYGGRIHAARVVPEGLVVATENGCLMAVKR